VTAETLRIISGVKAAGPQALEIAWSNGATAVVDFTETLRTAPYKSLRIAEVFAKAEVGEWGHSLVWPAEVEIGADSLWLDSLSVWGRDDTRAFLEWRLRNGLSLTGAAEALGLSRRQIAYYSSGEKTVPKPILLACRGWEALQAA
jgi:hypothetical protein